MDSQQPRYPCPAPRELARSAGRSRWRHCGASWGRHSSEARISHSVKREAEPADSFDWSFAQIGFPAPLLTLGQTPGCDKDVGPSVISNKNYLIETPEQVAAGTRKALEYVAPERIRGRACRRARALPPTRARIRSSRRSPRDLRWFGQHPRAE